MADEYVTPDFLKNQSAAEIHQRMLALLPDNIDKSEGQIVWDFTRPAALEKAELVEFELNETVQIMFVQWAYGEWLDAHAYANGLSRRDAGRAAGEVTVTAVSGTVIPEGFQFATPADISSSVVFETTKETSFETNFDGTDAKENVTLKIPVRAVIGGEIGNVPAESVNMCVKPLKGIISVINKTSVSGGTEAEDDESLRARILDLFKNGASFVGCEGDYIRWAKEVAGVGSVIVEPEWNDPNMPDSFRFTDGAGKQKCVGTVRLFVVDSNGAPANDRIINDVYNHIMRPDSPADRLAPIGAYVTVCAPEEMSLRICAKVTLKDGYNTSDVIKAFKNNLSGYWARAADEKIVKYVFIGSILADTGGVDNYDSASLTVNGTKADIPISLGKFPVVGEVVFNE